MTLACLVLLGWWVVRRLGIRFGPDEPQGPSMVVTVAPPVFEADREVTSVPFDEELIIAPPTVEASPTPDTPPVEGRRLPAGGGCVVYARYGHADELRELNPLCVVIEP